MKKYFILLSISFLLINCNEKNNPLSAPPEADFAIYLLKDRNLTIRNILETSLTDLELENMPWLSASDVYFYDYSSHCIYLKKEKNELFTLETGIQMNDQPFVVYANNVRCYVGTFHSLALSTVPLKPYIDELVTFYYPADVLHISKAWNDDIDSRCNDNIQFDLAQAGKLHYGLSLTIDYVKVIVNSDTSTVQYTFTLKNNDKDNLYVLDPDKMGTKLFHYYTNGVGLQGKNSFIWSQYKVIERPEPHYNWKPEWFTKITKGSSIKRTVVLKGYPRIPPGVYECTFEFPSPKNISKEERYLSDGRYWLGDVESEITVGIN